MARPRPAPPVSEVRSSALTAVPFRSKRIRRIENSVGVSVRNSPFKVHSWVRMFRTLDYQDEGRRVILEYYDFDHTGHVDMIRKCVASCKSDDIKSPNVIYELEYDAALGEASYKKYDNRRIWLGFLYH